MIVWLYVAIYMYTYVMIVKHCSPKYYFTETLQLIKKKYEEFTI